jgi:hypothetical protein
MKFKIGHETNHEIQHNHIGPRYIINEQNYDRFDKNLKEFVAMKFQMENSEGLASLDSDLATCTKETSDIESAVENFRKL